MSSLITKPKRPKLSTFVSSADLFTYVYPRGNMDLHSFLHLIGVGKDGPWIAGGAALAWYKGETIDSLTDVDIFFANKDNFDWVDKIFNDVLTNPNDKLDDFSKLFSKDVLVGTNPYIHRSHNATTIRFSIQTKIYTIQLIKARFHDNIQSVIDSFDISVCKVATDGKHFYLGENTAHDINNKILRYDGEFKMNSLPRILKYQTYGYKPTDELVQRMRDSESLYTEIDIEDVNGYNNIA